MKDGYFAHFYNGPTEVMENIPSHVIFMIDTASTIYDQKY